MIFIEHPFPARMHPENFIEIQGKVFAAILQFTDFGNVFTVMALSGRKAGKQFRCQQADIIYLGGFPIERGERLRLLVNRVQPIDNFIDGHFRRSKRERNHFAGVRKMVGLFQHVGGSAAQLV